MWQKARLTPLFCVWPPPNRCCPISFGTYDRGAKGHFDAQNGTFKALNQPFRFEKPFKVSPLPWSDPAISAHRSIPAVRKLRARGYEARQLRGGMLAWWRAGLPCERGNEGVGG